MYFLTFDLSPQSCLMSEQPEETEGSITEHTPALPQTRHFHKKTFDMPEWWTPWMRWPLSSGRPFHPPSLHPARHPSISTHVDETEIDEDVSDGQPFHSNTANEFWLLQPTLLCRRLILTQDAFRPWQSSVSRRLFFRVKIEFTLSTSI